MKSAPPRAVAQIHFTALLRSPLWAASTPKTIVKLLESRTKVITEAKTIPG